VVERVVAKVDNAKVESSIVDEATTVVAVKWLRNWKDGGYPLESLVVAREAGN
jgi:hypothetical protein